MKQTKLLSVLLALLLVFALSAGTFAAEITIDGGATNSEYAAYKLLNATNSADDHTKFAYTLNDKYTSILQEATGKTTQKDIVAYIQNLNASEIRAFADNVYKKIKDASPAITSDYTTSTDKFENVDQGYYLIVETRLGTTADTYSLVMLDTAGLDNVTVSTKENAPTVDKQVEEKNDSTGVNTWGESADYDIGDVINFKITGKVSSKYADYKSYYYSFADTMSDGLTYNKDAKVFVVNDSVRVEVTQQFNKVAESDQSFTIDANLKELTDVTINENTTIVVEYTATLNENAVSGSAGNKNEVILKYENDPYHKGDGNPSTPDKPENPSETPKDTNIVFTYDLTVNKVDASNKPLEGAGFTLFKFSVAENEYVAIGNEITGVTTFYFKGLDAGQYKLVETTVPAGYNKADDIEFIIKATYDTNKDPVELAGLQVTKTDSTVISTGSDASFNADMQTGKVATKVVNTTGPQLPSTGGMGTTLFYVLGSVLLLGAVVLLVVRRRMRTEK